MPSTVVSIGSHKVCVVTPLTVALVNQAIDYIMSQPDGMTILYATPPFA